jgi:hypothetical protein
LRHRAGWRLLAAPGRLAITGASAHRAAGGERRAAGGGPGAHSRPNMRRPDKNFKAADFRLISGL